MSELLTASVVGKVAVSGVVAAPQARTVCRGLEELDVRLVSGAGASRRVAVSAVAAVGVVLSTSIAGNNSLCLAGVDAARDLLVAARRLDVGRLEEAGGDASLVARWAGAEGLGTIGRAVLGSAHGLALCRQDQALSMAGQQTALPR